MVRHMSDSTASCCAALETLNGCAEAHAAAPGAGQLPAAFKLVEEAPGAAGPAQW